MYRARPPLFRPNVLLYLDTREPAASGLLGPHDHAQLKRLVAATMRDISGLGYDEIANALGYKSDVTARKRVTAGRRIWPALWAWPWRCWSEGSPPGNWLKSGPDAALTALLQTWLTGEPVVAAA